MAFWKEITTFATAVREFIVPSYHPERHYMRGPGPACAKRGTSLEARVTFH